MIVSPPASSGATQGRPPISTTSISAQSTQTIGSQFSSSYENYEVLITVAGSTGANLQLQLTAAGTATATGYYEVGRHQNTANTAANIGADNANFAVLGKISADAQSTIRVIISRPNVAAYTNIVAEGDLLADTTVYRYDTATTLANTTQYDGIKLLAASGNMTGTVRIYGYN